MARRPSTEAKASPKKESTVSAATEAAPEATAEVEIDLTEFKSALATAVAERDESTGTVPEAALAPVQAVYRQLEGLKAKNAARKLVEEAMREAMVNTDLPLARAHLDISKGLTAGGGGGKARAERAPVDPTEAYTQRVAGLALAVELSQVEQPEGVAEDWAEKVNELVTEAREAAKAYRAWLTSEDEDKGDAPEAPAFAQAAAKLSVGRSAKIGGAKSGGGGGTFTGERRDVAAHIRNAFAGVESGTFLKIAEIRKIRSEEYGDDAPSAGAISARLFPKSGKAPVGLDGIEPGQDESGNRGARKL